MITALEGGEESASRPGRFLPPGKTRYPLYRGLGGPHGRSGQVRKISPPPGFDPRSVQPVASRYTDYATRPTSRQDTSPICISSLLFMFPETLVVNTFNVDKRFWLVGIAQKGPEANMSTGSRPGAFSARERFSVA